MNDDVKDNNKIWKSKDAKMVYDSYTYKASCDKMNTGSNVGRACVGGAYVGGALYMIDMSGGGATGETCFLYLLWWSTRLNKEDIGRKGWIHMYIDVERLI